MTQTKLTIPPLWLLIALQAVISAASLVVEIVAGRMLAPYVGMSLYTWTSIIAVVLAGFSLGHWIGGRIADLNQSKALAWTLISMVLAAVTTAAAIWILRGTSGAIITAAGNPVLAIVALSCVAFFLPSLAAGVPAPVLAKVSITSGEQSSGQALGAMFAASAVGAIFGTLAAGFVFISYLGTALTMASMTVLYCLVAAVLLIYTRLEAKRLVVVAVLALLALALALGGVWMRQVCDRESNYFCIRVQNISNTASEPINMMILDHLVHGTSAKNRPDLMFTDYAALLDAVTLERTAGQDFSAFLIGGGTFSLPRKWSELGLSSDITVAEIDPVVTQVAMQDFWFSSPQVRVLNQDARLALARDERRYDVIVGDAFTDIAVPPHLITREFFGLVRSRLSDDGVYVMNVIDHMGEFRVAGSLVKTLRQVFPSVEVWIEARQAAPGERLVMVIAAGASQTPASQLTARTPQLKTFAALSDAWLDKLTSTKGTVELTDDFAPIDRLMGMGH